MEEIKYKHFAWSYDKQQLDEIIEELEKRQIACVSENNFGIYLLSVPQKYYQNALEIIREIGSEDQVGSINYYGRFRPLKAYSLAYAYLKDAKGLNKSWEDEFSRPQKIRKMVKQLRDICGCDIELIVNPNDSAIEIMTTKKISKTAKIRDRVYNFLNNNNYVKFKETYICTPDGKI
ncbi:MAG: hypothetical protein K2G03_06660, partial [Bacilli bacterium]|nr:hypothetical protein [Bacilli bacterium]